jgi:hypothetical protein
VEITASVFNALGLPVPAASVSLETTMLAPGPERHDPAAPDEERWLELAPGLRWLEPVLTDAAGAAAFAFLVPVGTAGMLRLRGRAWLPPGAEAPETRVLPERKPVFLAVEPPSGAASGAFITPEAKQVLTRRLPLADRALFD